MLEKRPLKDQLVSEIQRLIVTGQLKPGERIKEQEISDLFGISRSIVREALIVLECQGLIVSIPYAGTQVASVSRDDVERLLLPVRAHIESYALELIFENGQLDACIQAMEGQLSCMKEAVAQKDMGAFNVADLNFHKCIIDFSNSVTAKSAWSSIDQQSRMHLGLQTAMSGNLTEFFNDHLHLIHVFREGDLAKCTRALREHIIDKNIPLLDFLEVYERRST